MTSHCSWGMVYLQAPCFLLNRSLQNGPLRGLRIVQNVAHTAWAANKLFNHFSKKQGRSKLIRTFKNFIVKQAKRTDPPLYCAPSCPAIISFFNSKPERFYSLAVTCTGPNWAHHLDKTKPLLTNLFIPGGFSKAVEMIV